jgi:hypothetical protein
MLKPRRLGATYPTADVAVIPNPDDQIGHRKRRGSGGALPAFNAEEDSKDGKVVERKNALNKLASVIEAEPF